MHNYKPTVNPLLIQHFHDSTDHLFDRKGRALNLLSVAHADAFKMQHWIAFAGAVYPAVTRATVYRPRFLVAAKGYDQTKSMTICAVKNRKWREEQKAKTT